MTHGEHPPDSTLDTLATNHTAREVLKASGLDVDRFAFEVERVRAEFNKEARR